MMRDPLGWSYPAGAENDPNAPWNLPEYERCEICGDTFEDEDDRQSCGCEFCEVCETRLTDGDDFEFNECRQCSIENSQNSFDGYAEQ